MEVNHSITCASAVSPATRGPSHSTVAFSVQVVTVNCARIIHGNQVATNGVVHVVDRVVSSVGNSIADVLDVDDDLTTLTVRIYMYIYIHIYTCIYEQLHSPDEA